MIYIFQIISCILGGSGAWFIKKYGMKVGIIDVPNERSSHKNVVPKGGGIGILATVIICSVVLDVPKSFWLSALVLALVSFAGDWFDIRPRYRLTIQFCCSLVFLLGVNSFLYETDLLNYLKIILLIVFIAGTSNFYNFMDGINGIAGITGVIGFFLLAFHGYDSGVDPKYILLSVSIACSCVGFLPFNIPNAKVFMGDVGSVLLGFTFACMVLILSRNLLDFICLVSFLFPFYADELITMVVRIYDGDNLTRPHRKHIYQLLANENGFVHWKVALGYGLSQLFVGISVIMIKPYGIVALISVLVLYFFIFIRFSVYVRMKNRLSKL